MAMRRRPSPTQAKSIRCYTVEEAVRLYGCHKNTVRNWIRLGLMPIDDRRPMMFKGNALNAFHAAQRRKIKRPCGPGELYCVPCHKPQRPAGDMAEYVALNPKVGKLQAICPDCGRMLFQRVNAARLAVFRSLIDVTDAKL
jgi:hypothetical protein